MGKRCRVPSLVPRSLPQAEKSPMEEHGCLEPASSGAAAQGVEPGWTQPKGVMRKSLLTFEAERG